MPLAKIHVLEGQYDEAGSAGCRAPSRTGSSGPWGFPRRTSSRSFTFCRRANSVIPIIPGLNYSDDLIVLEITFISGRPKEKRLGLLKALIDAVVSAAAISPDDLLITLYETPGENISFGRGLAQRAHVADQEAAAALAAES